MPLGSGHILLIVILLIVVLIIWGPGKLPDIGAGAGRAIKEFKKATTDTKDAVSNSMKDDEPATKVEVVKPVTPSGETKPEEHKVSN